ncbi:hypothetical protein, partial [Yersinia enterocolitica]|uniref:hypothetical protein n=1 Tax=Yersinia enterocolitica TaxID=630 RepID=UPI001E2E6DE2
YMVERNDCPRRFSSKESGLPVNSIDSAGGPGADALLFYLPSPCKIELSKFVSSLTPLRPFFCLDLALITQGVDE